MGSEMCIRDSDCGLLSVADVSQTLIHSDGCDVALLAYLCPAVLNSLSTGAEDGCVVLNLMNTFWIRLYLASIISSVSVSLK